MKPESGNSGPSERYLEKLITSTCASIIRTDLHPHTAISITLQIENNAGSVSSSLVLCTHSFNFLCLCMFRRRSVIHFCSFITFSYEVRDNASKSLFVTIRLSYSFSITELEVSIAVHCQLIIKSNLSSCTLYSCSLYY